MTTTTTKPLIFVPRVCFSFAAYSKSIINHLRSSGVPIAAGLSDDEFSSLESAHRFRFPPDLRSILREGLPIGPGFPNWRSFSPNHLQALLSLPISTLIHEISRPGTNLWPSAWGPKPESKAESVAKARLILSGAAQLVPVYRQFYIAANPSIAGNPLFCIHGGYVRCCGFDLADFFQREKVCFSPAWTAKEARRIEVWSELADCGGEETRLEQLMEELGRRLREGGWSEEEVSEMMGAGRSDGWDDVGDGDRTVVSDRECVMWHLERFVKVLLRAGWSEEDIIYVMGDRT